MKYFEIVWIIFVILITLVILYKYKKYSEQFVQDFDDILDNKCAVITSNTKDNYIFTTGECVKNMCPTEQCQRLYYDTRINEYYYVTENSPKIETTNDNDDFSCVTKESIEDNIYCATNPPLCPYLGFTDVCYEYNCNDNQWITKNYKKQLDMNGDCYWRDTLTGTLKDEDELQTCRKIPLDCSACNIPCSTLPSPGVSFLDNYQKFRVSKDGNSCEIDPSYNCFECDETETKVAYKLNSDERRFETKMYRKQVVFGGKCVYMDDQGYCHPDETDVPQCIFENNIYPDKIDCLDHEQMTCCNLDDRDFFEKTQYRSVLSRDGTRCVYTTVDGSLSREIELDAQDGFNCPGYEYKLCSDDQQFRNIHEQKCTPCMPGRYMVDNTQFTDATACEDLPDCTGQFDYCFENLNEAGTVQIRKNYDRIPAVITSPDGSRPIAQCVSTTPNDCISQCDNPVTIENGNISDVYCDKCSGDTELNPLNFKCETKIDCPPERRECFDRHYYQFFDYNKQQDDPFSPCMYVKEGITNDKLELSDCVQECPPEYFRNGDKCEIPECEFSRNIEIESVQPLVPQPDDDEKLRVFDGIEISNEIKYDRNYCKINRMTKTIDITSSTPNANVCQVKRDTPKIPEVQFVRTGDTYRTNSSLNTEPEIKTGASGDCPVDCSYSLQPNLVDNICKDRNNNRLDYGPGEDTKGTTKKTHNKLANTKHLGKTCDVAKDEMKAQMSQKNYIKETDRGSSIEFEYQCDLPPRAIDCIHSTMCQVCSDRNVCDFKKDCSINIYTNSFGSGIPCPTNRSFTEDCPQQCGNCQDDNNSQWVYSDPSVDDTNWNNITPPEIGTLSFTRNKVTTNKCLQNGNPRNVGFVLTKETKEIAQRPLSQQEIDSVCNNDDNYEWNPILENVCDCHEDSNRLVSQTGTYKNNVTVRGINVSCENKTRNANCSIVYNTTRCTNARQATQDEINRRNVCTNPDNWEWSEGQCPTDCTYPDPIDIPKRKGNFKEAYNFPYTHAECSQYEIGDVSIPKTRCNKNTTTQYCINVENDRLAQIAAAEQQARENHCRSVNNWNWIQPTCPPDCTYTDLQSLPYTRGTHKFPNQYDCTGVSGLPDRNTTIRNVQCNRETSSTYCVNIQNEAERSKLEYCQNSNNWEWTDPSDCPTNCTYDTGQTLSSVRGNQKDTSTYDCSDVDGLPQNNGVLPRVCDKTRRSSSCDPCNIRDDNDTDCDDMYDAVKCLIESPGFSSVAVVGQQVSTVPSTVPQIPSYQPPPHVSIPRVSIPHVSIPEPNCAIQ